MGRGGSGGGTSSASTTGILGVLACRVRLGYLRSRRASVSSSFSCSSPDTKIMKNQCFFYKLTLIKSMCYIDKCYLSSCDLGGDIECKTIAEAG